jgi:hypothetical protein
VYIIKPKSLGLTDASLKEILPRKVKINIYEDLIWDRLKSIFSGYIDQLQNTIEPTHKLKIAQQKVTKL